MPSSFGPDPTHLSLAQDLDFGWHKVLISANTWAARKSYGEERQGGLLFVGVSHFGAILTGLVIRRMMVASLTTDCEAVIDLQGSFAG